MRGVGGGHGPVLPCQLGGGGGGGGSQPGQDGMADALRFLMVGDATDTTGSVLTLLLHVGRCESERCTT